MSIPEENNSEGSQPEVTLASVRPLTKVLVVAPTNTNTQEEWTAENPQFTLYSHDTGPNGFKVAMIMNELGLKYRTVLLDFGTGPTGMNTPYFESINPNARIPALVDHSRGGLVVWESGACITYLARKYDVENRLWAPTIEEQSQIETWLFYQVTGQSPYLGQAMWFTHYHHENLPSAAARYVSETRRVLTVLERQLTRPNSNGWLVLGRITVADIAYLHFYLHCKRIKIYLEYEFPAVWDWIHRIKKRKTFVGGKVPSGGSVRG
ncbi:protein URE2 [Peziza echinospora]|nr:protein URE2 [Peziza echinospora]